MVVKYEQFVFMAKQEVYWDPWIPCKIGQHLLTAPFGTTNVLGTGEGNKIEGKVLTRRNHSVPGEKTLQHNIHSTNVKFICLMKCLEVCFVLHALPTE
jgi:hypothetical protein